MAIIEKWLWNWIEKEKSPNTSYFEIYCARQSDIDGHILRQERILTLSR